MRTNITLTDGTTTVTLVPIKSIQYKYKNVLIEIPKLKTSETYSDGPEMLLGNFVKVTETITLTVAVKPTETSGTVQFAKTAKENLTDIYNLSRYGQHLTMTYPQFPTTTLTGYIIEMDIEDHEETVESEASSQRYSSPSTVNPVYYTVKLTFKIGDKLFGD